MKTAKQHLDEHKAEYPRCTQSTCPHQRNYVVRVQLNSGEGLIVTAQGFDEESATAAVRDGMIIEMPNLANKIKSIQAEILQPEYAHLFGLPPRE